jgi:mono/diheme cytochrome c family protein
MKISGLKLLTISAAIAISAFASFNASAGFTSEWSAVNSHVPGTDAVAAYAAKCAGCHGKDGAGLPSWKAKGQPDFRDARWQRSRTDAQLFDVIANGKGKFMPAWKGKLSDEEIGALVGRVRAFGKR